MASASGSSSMAATRSAATKPLIGHSSPDVPRGRLPSSEDVLKVLANFREKPRSQKKGVLAFCCPLDRKYQSLCLQEGGCGERDDPCLLLKVKLPWLQAGIVTISDQSIQKRLLGLNEKYSMIFRHRNEVSAPKVASREAFVESMKKTFDIKDANARQVILEDSNRSEESKTEDLSFFDDFLGPRLRDSG
jgi:hypothetical protein